jgi:hypothetical protein
MRTGGAKTAKQRVVEALQLQVAPLLAERGFRKRGTKFWRDSEAWCDVIQFEMSRWGTSTSGHLHIMAAVLWHKVERLVKDSDGRIPPLEYQCTRDETFGITGSAYGTAAWPVTSDTDPVALGMELAKVVRRRVCPWLERSHVLENLLVVRKSGLPLSFVNKLAVLHLLGRKREVEAGLRQARTTFEEDAPEHLRRTIVPFARRLGYNSREVKKLLG